MPPTLSNTLSSDEVPPLLRVSKLSVTYTSGSRPTLPALNQVSFDIAAREVIGVLGESGCGKSTLALSLLGLLPPGTPIEGEVSFQQYDLSRLSKAQLRSIWRAKISLIPQEASVSLSPVMRVGDQISEVIRAHSDLDRQAWRLEVKRLLNEVQLHEADRIYNAYPHQLSGGELHRVVVAQALACRPDLVIADEPTRSLDVRTQTEILDLLRRLNQKFGTAILLITHNPACLVGLAQRVLVMYAGHIVEEGGLAQVVRNPLHPYTKALLQLVPQSLTSGVRSLRKSLSVIPGSPPNLERRSQGCPFAPHCSQRMSVCGTKYPDEIAPEKGRRVSCFVYGG